MTLRLNGSSSGYTEIDAPAAAGSNTLTLPTGNGSANQFIKNGSTAGELEYSSMTEDSSDNVICTARVDATRFRCTDDGTASLPSINPGLDNDTGLFRPAGNTIGFSTAGSEKMRLLTTGELCVGTTSNLVFSSNTEPGVVLDDIGAVQIARQNEASLFVNRQGNDGVLVAFYQAGNFEGDISVSGTTVSYNGGHLSRWSQLAGGVERVEILRGSVLSNLDEMCEWGDEDNEQLNRMEVSTVEGDPNVAGVFQAWDDDDDVYTNDFYCAMTGDFVIRIAQGTTVARGDLLMSAGDGTAKPQDDDIVRSKTIAKVTSTVVSETYADGSYCVPCVLMAC